MPSSGWQHSSDGGQQTPPGVDVRLLLAAVLTCLWNRCCLCCPKTNLKLMVCEYSVMLPCPHVCFLRNPVDMLNLHRRQANNPLWELGRLKLKTLKEIGSSFYESRLSHSSVLVQGELSFYSCCLPDWKCNSVT